MYSLPEPLKFTCPNKCTCCLKCYTRFIFENKLCFEADSRVYEDVNIFAF